MAHWAVVYDCFVRHAREYVIQFANLLRAMVFLLDCCSSLGGVLLDTETDLLDSSWRLIGVLVDSR